LEADINEKCLQGKAIPNCFLSEKQVKVRVPWIVTDTFKMNFDISRLIPHPDYQHSCKVRDIALIELKKTFKCDPHTLPL
ncbi:hypothetical protein NPIL_681051, partial [Nephila pilipes]